MASETKKIVHTELKIFPKQIAQCSAMITPPQAQLQSKNSFWRELAINHRGRGRKDTDSFPYCTTYRINVHSPDDRILVWENFSLLERVQNLLFRSFVSEWNFLAGCLLFHCPFIIAMLNIHSSRLRTILVSSMKRSLLLHRRMSLFIVLMTVYFKRSERRRRRLSASFMRF